MLKMEKKGWLFILYNIEYKIIYYIYFNIKNKLKSYFTEA